MNSSNTFQWEINPRTRSDCQLADERTSLKKLRENLWIELYSRFPLELTSEELDEFERWIEESPEEPYVDELAELEQFIEDQWIEELKEAKDPNVKTSDMFLRETEPYMFNNYRARIALHELFMISQQFGIMLSDNTNPASVF